MRTLGGRVRKSIQSMAVLLGAAMSFNAEALTNKELMDHCESDSNWKKTFCVGYVAGAVSQGDPAAYFAARSALSHLTDEEFEQLPEGQFDRITADMEKALYGCSADKSFEQLAAVFVKWVKDNPEQWHDYPDYSIPAAVREAFPPPCSY